MKEEYGARIERGIIRGTESGGYTVQSYDRSGLITPPLVPLDPNLSCSAGDKVYFFLFSDGTGKILGKIGV